MMACGRLVPAAFLSIRKPVLLAKHRFKKDRSMKKLYIDTSGTSGTVLRFCIRRTLKTVPLFLAGRKGEPLLTASGGNFKRGKVIRKEVVSTVWSNDH